MIIAYVAGGRSLNSARLVWTDRTGKVEPLPLPERDYENVMISPDGTRAIVQIRGAKTELWIYDFARSTLTPIGESAGSSQSPLWTADGTHIIYRGTNKGFRNLYWRMADGSGSKNGSPRSKMRLTRRRPCRPTATGSCSMRVARRNPAA